MTAEHNPENAEHGRLENSNVCKLHNEVKFSVIGHFFCDSCWRESKAIAENIMKAREVSGDHNQVTENQKIRRE